MCLYYKMSRDECEMNCERILQWARNKRGKVFVESILEWVRENDHVTERQMECVDENIIEKFIRYPNLFYYIFEYHKYFFQVTS